MVWSIMPGLKKSKREEHSVEMITGDKSSIFHSIC